jgi:hypothetical protein
MFTKLGIFKHYFTKNVTQNVPRKKCSESNRLCIFMKTFEKISVFFVNFIKEMFAKMQNENFRLNPSSSYINNFSSTSRQCRTVVFIFRTILNFVASTV